MNNNLFNKLKNENFLNYVKRMVGYRISGDFIGTYREWYKIVFKKDYSEDVARRQFYGAKDFILILCKEQEDDLEDLYDKDVNNDSFFTQLQELKIEKQKIRDERIILNQSLKERSRFEFICDEIAIAIKELPNIAIPKELNVIENNKSGILAISDIHYGKEFEIKGLLGEIINSYNIDIFEKRMWKLRDYVLNIIKKENLTNLFIFNLGDFIENILRVSAIQNIKLGMTDSTIAYSYFMINWLNELSKHIRITYMQVSGNHDEARILTGKKGDFPSENMGKIVFQMLKLGLKENKNIKIIENYDDNFIYTNIQGYDILGVHSIGGEKYNAIKDFENVYCKNISILLTGHYHNSNSQNVSIDKEVIGLPSIIGSDDYSIKLRKTSNAGAKLIIIEKDYGIFNSYDIKLK